MRGGSGGGRELAERFYPRRGVVRLWVGFLGGPAAWFFHLMVSYALVRYVCRSGAVWLLHLTTLVALGAAAAAIRLAWTSWRRAGEPVETRGGGVEGRSRFLALAGLLFAAFSALLVAAEGLPNFVLEPCL